MGPWAYEIFHQEPVYYYDYGASISSTTYFCDGLWAQNSGTIVPILGSCRNNETLIGLWAMYVWDPASNAANNIGASISSLSNIPL